MVTSPISPCTRRPVRVRLSSMPSATIRFGDGERSSARIQTISVTGGLLQVLKPLSSGAVVELLFSTNIGSVLAMAELLAPCPPGLIGLQPFRFIAMDRTELRKLGAVIDSSWEREIGRSSASANQKSGLPQSLSIATQ
jgi:hypothetical protein